MTVPIHIADYFFETIVHGIENGSIENIDKISIKEHAIAFLYPYKDLKDINPDDLVEIYFNRI